MPVNWGFDRSTPNFPFPWPLFNTMLPGTAQVSLPNGISLRPTALAGCTSVADDIYIHTYRREDHATVTCLSAFSDATRANKKIIILILAELGRRFQSFWRRSWQQLSVPADICSNTALERCLAARELYWREPPGSLAIRVLTFFFLYSLIFFSLGNTYRGFLKILIIEFANCSKQEL